MGPEVEQVLVSRHDGLSTSGDRGCQYFVIVGIAQQAGYGFRSNDVGKQLQLTPYLPRSVGPKTKLTEQQVFEFIEERRAGREIELSVDDLLEKHSRNATKQDGRGHDIGVEEDAQPALARAAPRAASRLDHSGDGLFRKVPIGRQPFSEGEDLLPTLDPLYVLAKCLAKKLAAGPAFRLGQPVHFSEQVWGERNRDGTLDRCHSSPEYKTNCYPFQPGDVDPYMPPGVGS
jgi:hypothetical protein